MQKKYILFTPIIIAIIFLGFAHNASAQTIQADVKVDARVKAKMLQDKAAELQTRMEIKKAESSRTISSRFKKASIDRLANIVATLEEAINRIDRNMVRVVARINIMEKGGQSVANVRLLVERAKIKLNLAKENVIGLKAMLAITTTTGTEKEVLVGVRKQIVKAKDSVADAHKALVNVIKEIRPTSVNAEIHATSTATSSTPNQ